MEPETAVSDLVGAMVLVAVFAAAAGIVGATLVLHPPGDAPPAMLVSMESNRTHIHIHHEGGDPLERGRFAILVDGERTDFSLVDADDDWTSWGIGQTLVLGGSYSSIRIVGESAGGSTWLLHDLVNETAWP